MTPDDLFPGADRFPPPDAAYDAQFRDLTPEDDEADEKVGFTVSRRNRLDQCRWLLGHYPGCGTAETRRRVRRRLALSLVTIFLFLSVTDDLVAGAGARDAAPADKPRPRQTAKRAGDTHVGSHLQAANPRVADIRPAANAGKSPNRRGPARPVQRRPRRPGKWLVTAYCPCPSCCGGARGSGQGITASGRPVTANGGRFVAAPGNVPFGTLIDIPGYGRVPVLDRGGAIRGRRLDVYFPRHALALAWGARRLAVKVHRKGL